MAKLTIDLRPDERQALEKAAHNDRRAPRDQAAVIVVRELERAGLLPTDAQKANIAQGADDDHAN